MTRCELCEGDYKNIYQHYTTYKHLRKSGVKNPEIYNNNKNKKVYIYDNMKEYQKYYYEQNNLKEKATNKIKCDICDKLISVCNFSHHKTTWKHKIKADDRHLFKEESPYISEDEIEINQNLF